MTPQTRTIAIGGYGFLLDGYIIPKGQAERDAHLAQGIVIQIDMMRYRILRTSLAEQTPGIGLILAECELI